MPVHRFDTRLTMTECLERLGARTGREPILYWLASLSPGFYSRTKGDRFRVRLRRPAGTIQPSRILFGRVQQTASGCRVRTRVRLPIAAQIFCTFWFGSIAGFTILLGYGIAACYLSRCSDADFTPWLGLLFCLGLLAFGWLIILGTRAGTADLLQFVQDTFEARAVKGSSSSSRSQGN